MNPTVIMLYVFCLTDEKYQGLAERFVDTYQKFPAEYPHSLWVICNGARPNDEVRRIFKGVPCIFLVWDDTGWDIGAYKFAADEIVLNGVKCDALLCCGGNTNFRRAGWMRRLVEAWKKHGPGLYGATASYEQRPHIQTTTFLCPPGLIHSYPYPLVTKEDRYNFEWGRNSILTRAERRGYPCLMVTWDGEWTKDKWRIPPNIFRRGDQSNVLAYYLATEAFDALQSEEERKRQAMYADGLFNDENGVRDFRRHIDAAFKAYPDATEREEAGIMNRCLPQI